MEEVGGGGEVGEDEEEDEMKYEFGGVFEEKKKKEGTVFLQLYMVNATAVLSLVDEAGDFISEMLIFCPSGDGNVVIHRRRNIPPNLCKSLGWERDDEGRVIFD